MTPELFAVSGVTMQHSIRYWSSCKTIATLNIASYVSRPFEEKLNKDLVCRFSQGAMKFYSNAN